MDKFKQQTNRQNCSLYTTNQYSALDIKYTTITHSN